MGGIENVLRGKDGQILGLGRARRGAPRFPSVDQAEPTRSATASTAATRRQRSGGPRWRNQGGLQAILASFSKSPPVLSKFPKKALAVLWDSKGLQGVQTRKDPISKFFAALAPYQPDVAAVAIRSTIRGLLAGPSLSCDPVDDDGRPRPPHAELKRASGSSRSAAAIVTLPALIVSFSLGERGEGKNRGASRSDTAA